MDVDSLNALIQTQKRFVCILTQQLYYRGLRIGEMGKPDIKGDFHYPDGAFDASLFKCASRWRSEHVATQVLKMSGLKFKCYPYKSQERKYLLSMMLVMVAAGNRIMVELFMRTHSVNEEDWGGRAAIHWAVLKRREVLIRILLKAGANATHADKIGVTPIMLQATMTGSQPILNILIESAQKSGNDIFGVARDGKTVLHFAAKYGNVDAIRLFLDLGADASKQDDMGDYPLLMVLKSLPRTLNRPIVQAMVENFGEVSRPNSMGETPLHFAAKFSELWLIELLLMAGADISAKILTGETALHFAALAGRDDPIIDLLIQHGANPYAYDWLGRSPLTNAQMIENSRLSRRFHQYPLWIGGRSSRVEYKLLRTISNAKVIEVEQAEFVSNIMGNYDSNCALSLHFLCSVPTSPQTSQTTHEMVYQIIECGIQFTAKDASGFTPLHYAAQTGKKKMLELFFVRGHNAYCTKYNGVKLDRRNRSKFKDAVEGLLVAGRTEGALEKDSNGVCGIDRWATSIQDPLSFVVVNRLLARANILACLGECDETYWLI